MSLATNEHLAIRFDYEEVFAETVTAILGRPDGDLKESWESVAIVIGPKAMIFFVDSDTDQIIVALQTAPEVDKAEWRHIVVLSELVGQKIGYSWVGQSWRGYFDLFILSFDVMKPQFCFEAIASALKIRRLEKLE